MATPRLELKPEPDGAGYLYGRLDAGDESYRIDVLPPASEPRPYFVTPNASADPKLWIVHVDGEELGRVARRDQIEPLLVKHLAGLDRVSSASRQHFIDTGRYLRTDEVDE